MTASRRYWLLKSEPDVFSFEDLLASRGKRTGWDGVRNYQARNFMRDDMQVGDGVLYYHSRSKTPSIVGLARVTRGGHPDPTQFEEGAKGFDGSSDPKDPRWFQVTIQGVEVLPQPLSLGDLKEEKSLADMALVQRGQRLSVQPVGAKEWRRVLQLGGIKGDPTGS
ncbi:MAG: EVE domain-containing protein [Planctomycetota bacterium]|jgi:predicted RNA-binding protein with PUA-like domain|nr:EVE domain-containing protein [Planctomycetota bacterium]